MDSLDSQLAALTVTSENPTHFSDLPPEIRVRIYQYLFREANAYLTADDANNTILHGNFPTGILRICKKINYEATEVLGKMTKLTVDADIDQFLVDLPTSDCSLKFLVPNLRYLTFVSWRCSCSTLHGESALHGESEDLSALVQQFPSLRMIRSRNRKPYFPDLDHTLSDDVIEARVHHPAMDADWAGAYQLKEYASNIRFLNLSEALEDEERNYGVQSTFKVEFQQLSWLKMVSVCSFI